MRSIGAAAVLLQLRVGGQATRDADETWPLDCGCIGQETTGAGGLAKALRTVPVVLDIAEHVRKANPDAWIVDFTNPVGIVTRALLQEGHRAIGLCNVAIGFQRRFAAMLGVAPERIGLDHVGLNHLTWERAVLLDGHDVLPELLADHLETIAEEIELPPSVVQRLQAVPSYYLRYFYAHDQVVRELRSRPSRAKEVAAIEQRLLDIYADPDRGGQAGRARRARWGVLLRGGGGPPRVAAGAGRGGGLVCRARGQRRQQRHASVPRRRPRDRGVGPGRTRRGPSPCPWRRWNLPTAA